MQALHLASNGHRIKKTLQYIPNVSNKQDNECKENRKIATLRRIFGQLISNIDRQHVWYVEDLSKIQRSKESQNNPNMDTNNGQRSQRMA